MGNGGGGTPDLRAISYYGTSTPDASIPGTPSCTPLRPRRANRGVLSLTTAVHQAAESGDIGMVEQALGQLEPALKLAAISQPDVTTGCSVLHAACAGGNPHVVTLLLHEKADPIARTNSAATPLHFAASVGSHLAALALLDAGVAAVDPNAKDVHGCKRLLPHLSLALSFSLSLSLFDLACLLPLL